MGQAQTQKSLRGPASVGVGWRAFQVAGLVTAVSWLVSYFIIHDPYGTMLTIFGLENPVWVVFGISYMLSPLLSLVLIAIALWPGALAVLNRDDRVAVVARGVMFVVPTLWLLSGFFGGNNSMVNQMLTNPIGSSMTLPVIGGNLLHLVFQHWFQGFAAILLALVPGQFATLTNSDRPAGTGAVVREVSAEMELERRLAALHEATRDMMDADSPGEVATIAASATSGIVGIPYSRVHLQDEDDDELVPAAWTDETERALDGDPPTLDEDSGLVWERYRTGEAGYFHEYDAMEGADDRETPLESSLLLPLGEHGIMLLQSTEPAAFTETKLEMAHILSANTQAALARLARERELELVRALLDQSSESVYVIDPETGLVVDVNEHACHQLRYTRDELLSMRFHEVVAAVDELPDVGAVVQAAREQGIVTLEGTHQRTDGSTFPVHLTVNHIELEQEYLLALATDVTEHKERQQELAIQRTELERLGFVQTLVDELVQQVLGPGSRATIELEACELLAESPFYADAWLVDPSEGDQSIGSSAGTTDGGQLRTVDELPPEDPATAAVRDTIETNDTHVLEQIPGEPATAASDATADRPAPGSGPAITLPLTYGESNYGALIVRSNRDIPVGEREQSALETLSTALAFAVHVRVQEAAALRDDTIELEFQAAESTALVDTLAAKLEGPVRLEGLVPEAGDTVRHYYVAETDTGADELRDLVEATDPVADCRLIDRDRDDECLLEVEGPATDILDRIVDAGAVIHTAVARPDQTRLCIDLPPGMDPAEGTALVQAGDSNWTLTGERQVERPVRRMQAACQSLEESLTDKQREALLTAYFAGYYDYPRTSAGQEVANTLAISDSTLFQHLQAAQRKVIQACFDPTEAADLGAPDP